MHLNCSLEIPAFMSVESAFRRFVLVLVGHCLFLTIPGFAQEKESEPAPSDQKGQQEADPLKRPLSEKQRKANEKALRQELSTELRRWLDQDVRWIITDEERAAFRQLTN